jgi:hypothetical protein
MDTKYIKSNVKTSKRNTYINTVQESVEPGDAPREGFGHKKVYKR